MRACRLCCPASDGYGDVSLLFRTDRIRAAIHRATRPADALRLLESGTRRGRTNPGVVLSLPHPLLLFWLGRPRLTPDKPHTGRDPVKGKALMPPPLIGRECVLSQPRQAGQPKPHKPRRPLDR